MSIIKVEHTHMYMICICQHWQYPNTPLQIVWRCALHWIFNTIQHKRFDTRNKYYRQQILGNYKGTHTRTKPHKYCVFYGAAEGVWGSELISYYSYRIGCFVIVGRKARARSRKSIHRNASDTYSQTDRERERGTGCFCLCSLFEDWRRTGGAGRREHTCSVCDWAFQ